MIHNLNFAYAMVWIMLTQFSLLNPIVFVTFTLGIHGVYQVFQTDVLHIVFHLQFNIYMKGFDVILNFKLQII